MADRAETFEMRREFDAVRERYHFLKTQPDMAEMDAELLTIAAQMSEQTRDLAKTYSASNIARAKEALLQRRSDTEALAARIKSITADMLEVRRLMEDVDTGEGSVTDQLKKLQNDMQELEQFMPEQPVFQSRGNTPFLKTVPAE